MTAQLTYHCLVLAPIPAIPYANQAAVDVTGLEASRNTFSVDNIMLKGDVEYACAGVYVTGPEYENLEPLATQLAGFYYPLWLHDGSKWTELKSKDDCMVEHGISYPVFEEEGVIP